jgi:hypothetical protein
VSQTNKTTQELVNALRDTLTENIRRRATEVAAAPDFNTASLGCSAGRVDETSARVRPTCHGRDHSARARREGRVTMGQTTWVLLNRKLTTQHVLDPRVSVPRTFCDRPITKRDTRLTAPRDEYRTCRPCVWNRDTAERTDRGYKVGG